MRARRHLRYLVLTGVLVGFVALVIYAVVSGRTNSWHEVSCRVIGSRVVRADVQMPGYRSLTILYRGQFQLQYVVNEQTYAIWGNTYWVDDNPSFIQAKLAAHSEDQCEYLVRYNPRNPAEAVAKLR